MRELFYVLIALIICVTVIIVAAMLVKKGPTVAQTRSITRIIFLTAQISALIWVFTSYAIAVYSTVVLGQVYTMSELSAPAISTILGVNVLKVVENIFEHNDGFIFGNSKDRADGQQ